MFAVGKYLAIALALACACAGTAAAESSWTGWRNSPHAKMLPFKSEEAFRRYLAERAKRQEQRRSKNGYSGIAPQAAPAPADGMAAEATTSAKSDDKITNTQEAGVDEGGIVKVRGDILVILRRGRLFTVSTRNGELRPVDYIDAFPPGVNPSSDWYDEMLIAGDRIIVIGYSYGRGGTEINRFRLSGDGRLRFEDAYHLKSNDYYSSRNYASRLIGTRLIVYSPLYVPYNAEASTDWMPAVRRWSGNPAAPFQRIVGASDIYIPKQWEDPERASIDAIHTVTECDLLAPELRCRATSVLGPAGRTFYVSAHAVYVWVTDYGWWRPQNERNQSMLYRLPLDGSAPSAVIAHGAPVDQFSFREDWDDGVLNVLVRSDGGGDAMWNPEFSSGDIALVRFPLRDFGDGTDVIDRGRYRELPRPPGNAWAFQNRYVGNYLLYGTGNSWGAPGGANGGVVIASVSGRGLTQLPLDHGVDRIEAMGDDAVVIGANQRNLTFQAIELTQGWRPQLGDRYTLESASQGETRSHAFFFKPEARDGASGILGLPVTRFGLEEERRFSPLGELFASDVRSTNDGCRASCVDWYGNARPIFLRGRTFALMGYELVEGQITPRAIREIRRTNFAPGGRR
jgi:Beta propeller domain